VADVVVMADSGVEGVAGMAITIGTTGGMTGTTGETTGAMTTVPGDGDDMAWDDGASFIRNILDILFVTSWTLYA